MSPRRALREAVTRSSVKPTRQEGMNTMEPCGNVRSKSDALYSSGERRQRQSGTALALVLRNKYRHDEATRNIRCCITRWRFSSRTVTIAPFFSSTPVIAFASFISTTTGSSSHPSVAQLPRAPISLRDSRDRFPRGTGLIIEMGYAQGTY